MSKKNKLEKAPRRTSAVARAERRSAPISLSGTEKDILEEALRRGQDTRDEVQTSLMRFGRWLLDQVFGGNATEALNDKTRNAVWMELVRRAGGPTLQISRRLLYVCLRVAANDKRIND